MFRDVVGYLQKEPATQELPALARMLKLLEKRMGEIAEHRQCQRYGHVSVAGPAELRTRKRKLRQERMIPLARTARPLLKHAPIPEAVLRVPHASADPGAVAAHAERMLKALTPQQKLLSEAGYSKAWMSDFREEAKALRTAASSRVERRQQRIKATASLAEAFAKGMEHVDIAEGIIMGRYGPDSVERYTWRKARRVSARLGRPLERTRKARLQAVS
jgi:hypothetical protein